MVAGVAKCPKNMAVVCNIFILLKQILLCVLLAWIPMALSARCGGINIYLEYFCAPNPQFNFELMQKAFDANPMVEGRQRRRKRYVGSESLETQVNFFSYKKLK